MCLVIYTDYQLEKESFDTLVNVNSRLAVHSTATAVAKLLE